MGQYHLLAEEVFDDYVSKRLPRTSPQYRELKSRFFLVDFHLTSAIEHLANAYRTKKRFLWDFTTLHMLVITRRCNQSCTYCHASSAAEDAGPVLDMSVETLHCCIESILRSPSKALKIEFQGGEPTLRFDLVEEAVRYAGEANAKLDIPKSLEFVLCTNLVVFTPRMLDFVARHGIHLSTSLDGPEEIHDAQRPSRSGCSSHARFKENLGIAVARLGPGRVGALLTITPRNLHRLRDVVDEYVALGLHSIFLRPLNPFGRASEGMSDLGYTTEAFAEAYSDVLDYIISLNRQGMHFPEVYTTLLLSRILTPFSTGFVDLQSPAGVGIGGVIYDTTGDVFVSDEGRMLFYATGDREFLMGNIHRSSWMELFGSQRLRDLIAKSTLESSPTCAWCVFQSYCGSDPVRAYQLHGTVTPFVPATEFCKRQKTIFRDIFRRLEDADEKLLDIFWSWVTARDLHEIAVLDVTLA